MKMMWSRFMLVVVGIVLVVAKSPDFSICESPDASIVGGYSADGDTKMDGAPVYSKGDIAIFRNKGFWYIGNLGPWPPETYYRCVDAEACNMGEDTPPLGKSTWAASKKFGKEPVPEIVKGACQVDEL
jgi:hypothetical protein